MIRNLLVISLLLGVVSSQAITNAAMKKIFKYADPTVLGKLVTSLNKDTTLKAQQARITAWAPKNAIKPKSIISPSSDPMGTVKGSSAKAIEFLQHREALKKFVTFQFNATKGKFVTEAKAKECRTLFWAVDKQLNNNFKLVVPEYVKKMIPKLPAAKQPLAMNEMTKIVTAFATSNPTAAVQLNAFKFP